MNDLGLTHKLAGNLDRALPLYQETLRLRKAKLGLDHPATLMSMNNLARCYQAAGSLDLALPLFEETLQRRKSTVGPDHPDSFSSLYNLATAYLDCKQPKRALPLFADFVARQRRRLGPRNPRFADLLATLSLDLLKAREFAEAEKLLGEAAAIRAEVQPDAWTTFNTQAMLGASLLGQQKYTEAERLLKQGYDGMKQHEKAIPPQAKPPLQQAAAGLVQLYQATGRKEDAQKWTAVVVALDGKLLDMVHDAAQALTLTGELNATVPAVIFQVRLKVGVTYVIDLVSPNPDALDPYLVLQDAERKTLAEDDDSGGNLNARITYRAAADGVYRLRATAFRGAGPFTLTVRPKQ